MGAEASKTGRVTFKVETDGLLKIFHQFIKGLALREDVEVETSTTVIVPIVINFSFYYRFHYYSP